MTPASERRPSLGVHYSSMRPHRPTAFQYLWAEKIVGERPKTRHHSRPHHHGTHRRLSPLPRLSMTQSESDLEPLQHLGFPDSQTPQHHRSHERERATSSGIERVVATSGRRGGSALLVNILRALLARALFIVHSLTAIWVTATVCKENGIWTLALVSISIVIEGSYAVIMRAGDERKWFSPSVLIYIIATAPPIWRLELTLCEWRARDDLEKLQDQFLLQLLEQLLLVVLIVGRWLLPKGEISREQLSQILLAYLAMSSDIVEFFDVFKERPVYSDVNVQYIVLSAWTLSLLQFPFVLTVSRARKMRVAITDEVYIRKRTDCWQALYDIDLWAIVLANSLQDMPFLAVRLYLVSQHGLLTYTMAFFICKNVLIIALQTYRAFVLFNDRYLGPSDNDVAMAAELYTQPPQQHRRAHRKTRRGTLGDVEKLPIYNNNHRRPSHQRAYGTAQPTPTRSPHRRMYRQVRSSIDEE